ncbi:copper chaperone PCu(A)C [Streptomyces winkii]|uniref:copper chaperone PCu(A)C n=1 Tax=Streptomyces winkii TaxID=3051178 RepID=UPI0028D5BF33|nr:copper chaperone PCu(A)C [Streptomyces sp. DSM 40971]
MSAPSGTGAARALVDSLRSAAVPIVTCLAALAGLTAWTTAGHAGQPRGLEVSTGRIFTPLREGATSAFFTVRNTGEVSERLTGVTAAQGNRTMLSRNVTTSGGARTMTMVPYISVRPHSTLRMSPYALNVMVTPAPRVTPGERVRFTLHFDDLPPIRVQAVAVRPSEVN